MTPKKVKSQILLCFGVSTTFTTETLKKNFLSAFTEPKIIIYIEDFSSFGFLGVEIGEKGPFSLRSVLNQLKAEFLKILS